jgi:hypothetical protein
LSANFEVKLELKILGLKIKRKQKGKENRKKKKEKEKGSLPGRQFGPLIPLPSDAAQFRKPDTDTRGPRAVTHSLALAFFYAQ